MGILGKIEQAEREQELASKRSDKVLKETLSALGGKVEEGLKKSDPSADDGEAAFLEKESESDILKRQESMTVDNRATSAAARRRARRQRQATAGKAAATARDPAKEKAATTQSHRFARHQFLNAGNEKWHRQIGAHDRLEALSRLTVGIGSGAEAVSKGRWRFRLRTTR